MLSCLDGTPGTATAFWFPHQPEQDDDTGLMAELRQREPGLEDSASTLPRACVAPATRQCEMADVLIA